MWFTVNWDSPKPHSLLSRHHWEKGWTHGVSSVVTAMTDLRKLSLSFCWVPTCWCRDWKRPAPNFKRLIWKNTAPWKREDFLIYIGTSFWTLGWGLFFTFFLPWIVHQMKRSCFLQVMVLRAQYCKWRYKSCTIMLRTSVHAKVQKTCPYWMCTSCKTRDGIVLFSKEEQQRLGAGGHSLADGNIPTMRPTDERHVFYQIPKRLCPTCSSRCPWISGFCKVFAEGWDLPCKSDPPEEKKTHVFTTLNSICGE